MNLKKLKAQVSIFLSDGIMNPNKYKKNINDIFNDLFNNEILSLSIRNAPDDIPLVNYTSKDNAFSYTFSKKRINFTMNFVAKNKMMDFDEYKKKIMELINERLLSITDISRIGIAFLYYYDIDDKNTEYWIKKYNFPLTTKSTSELTYIINNSFKYDEVYYNNIINLSNISVNGKIVPSVSVDINNKEVKKLSEEQLEFIFNKCDKYKDDFVMTLLDKNDKQQ